MKVLQKLDFAGAADASVVLNPLFAAQQKVEIQHAGNIDTGPCHWPAGIEPQLYGLGSGNRGAHWIGDHTVLLAIGPQEYILKVGGPALGGDKDAAWNGVIEHIGLQAGDRAKRDGERVCDGLVIEQLESSAFRNLSVWGCRRGFSVYGTRRVDNLMFDTCQAMECDTGWYINGAVNPPAYAHSDTTLLNCSVEHKSRGCQVGVHIDSAPGGVHLIGTKIQGCTKVCLLVENNSRARWQGYGEVLTGRERLIVAKNNAVVILDGGILSNGTIEVDATSLVIVREGTWSRWAGGHMRNERRLYNGVFDA